MADESQQEKLREITIALDNYDDIFSDFDPRPYQERELSEDFLKEIQRRYMEDRKGRFEVHFTVPSMERDIKEESVIKKRLRGHFGFMAREEGDAVGRIKARGYAYMIIGSVVLLANIFSLFWLQETSLFYQILSIMLVPAGWYGVFTGMDKVIDKPFELVEHKIIYEKFERASYTFMSEELE